MYEKIKKNAAKCVKCGFVLESTHRHDFRSHSCSPEVWFMVDGGKDYIRRGWGTGDGLNSPPSAHFEDASEYVDNEIKV